ncbi:MAG: hypothetical protein M1374_01870 [Firmicutes bacterium]|jgi:hypothetical protein|nr:hypothetical protein [Bacillota bacterium]
MGYAKVVNFTSGDGKKFFVSLLCLFCAALVLASCSASQPSVTTWASGNSFSANNSQVLTDITGIKNGIRLKELEQLHTVCEALAADASTVYQSLPTPVPALTQAFSKAYNALAQAGHTCYYAPSFSSLQMAKFKKQFFAAQADLSSAMALYNTFG